MGELTQKIITEIKEWNNDRDIKDSLWIAGDLLAKVKTNNYHSGFDFIDAENVTAAECQELQTALLDLLARNDDLQIIAGVISALDKCADKRLKEFYINCLQQSLKALKIHNGIVYQSLMALEHINEEIFERDDNSNSAQSLMEVEKNIRQADQYLQKREIVIPW
jgi:hypothetical protein